MNDFRASPIAAVNAVWLTLTLLLSAFASAAADEPQEWLERMVQSARQLNYRGSMVHVCGGIVDAVQIVHRVENGQIMERITAVDAAGREIIRDGNAVMCVMPDQKSVMVEPRFINPDTDSRLGGVLPAFTEIDTANYMLAMRGPDHVAGYETEIVSIEPLDDYRYGYRLWLERKRAIALRFELLSEKGEPMEKIMFTDIQFFAAIDLDAMDSAAPVATYTWEKSAPVKTEVPADSLDTDGGHSGWQATELPAGFRLTAVRLKGSTDSATPVQQRVYSDGLVAVSVFIESGVDPAEQKEGPSPMGATNAYTRILEGHLVTAVGNVPVATVRMIASSMRAVTDGSPPN
jgi:sigma-E factor negative regulatory protein RseB